MCAVLAALAAQGYNMSHADNKTHGGKGVSPTKPTNPKQADINWSILMENNKRERSGLPIMTPIEADIFVQLQHA